MQYTINQVMPAGEFEGQYGKMLKYSLMLEGEQSAVDLNQKPDTPAPKVGDTIEGEIITDKYGRKFKKAQRFSGGNGKSDPATQRAIIRQNALTNAVNYCIAKATLKKDPDKYLTGKEVLQVATYFARYSNGVETIVSASKKDDPIKEQEEPQDAPQSQPEASESESEPSKEPVNPEDIDLDSIPF